MSVCYVCCVLTGKDLCGGKIPRPGESYGMSVCVCVCVCVRACESVTECEQEKH